ncbi:DUF808 domain-containing protein [Lewinella sp. IMCC34191]|uniref:DUF808 domain-containing protein n=1 Tax=Lewinella sp. IMCC34191 TaxID=2259172 RepID=UPI000E2416CA|nr:DUF808 domain-containing protein [Lewinella sp. IMCC34191]
MATGLLALLDDVSALVKASAASLDDVPAQVAKTTGKVSGIVIDDTAVTPKYVVGLDPSRELSIIYQIAKKSLINKVFILSPAALLLGFFAPWAITPILMLGGAYLCFEGYEKVHSLFFPHHGPEGAEAAAAERVVTAEELEAARVKGAVRTDMILSSEIVAITYSTVAEQDLLNQIIIMLAVAVFITVAVYGFVGLIVKADDIGVHIAKTSKNASFRSFGQGIVKFMPLFLKILGYVGTAAMLWVGAEIIAHGIPPVGHALDDLVESLSHIPVLGWLVKVTISALGGVVIGAIIAQVVTLVRRVF